MKNLNSTQTAQVKISLKDFKKLLINGTIGHHLTERSAMNYVSLLNMVIHRCCNSEREFLSYTSAEIEILIDIIEGDGAKKLGICNNTFKAIISAMNCYRNYLNYKHQGIIVIGKKSYKVQPKFKACNNNCKSFLWKLLNAFGLLKYI